MSSQESCSANLFERFSNNQMKTNPEKYYLLMNFNRPATMKTGEQTISNSYCEKLFGIKSQLNLTSILKGLLKKPVKRYNYALYVYFKTKVVTECFFQGPV